MCNQEKEVKAVVNIDIETLKEEASRTRRIEARAEMMKALPAVISACAPIVDSLTKVAISRHETLGSRLSEIELDQAERGQGALDLIVELGREFGVFENLSRLIKSEVDFDVAYNEKEIRDLQNKEENDDNDDNDDTPQRPRHKVGYKDIKRARKKGKVCKG